MIKSDRFVTNIGFSLRKHCANCDDSNTTICEGIFIYWNERINEWGMKKGFVSEVNKTCRIKNKIKMD